MIHSKREASQSSQPTLPEAPPISIRPYLPADVSLHFEAVRESQAELAPWMPWCHPGYSLEDSRGWVESQLVAFRDGVEYEFVITGADNRLLGGCGLNHIDRANLRANLGYWVRSTCCGRGIAVAAVKLLVAWAFAQTDLVRLEVIASVENVASQRVAEKAGALREGVLRSRLQLHGRRHDAAGYSFGRRSPRD